MKNGILNIGFILLSMILAFSSCADTLVEPGNGDPNGGTEMVPIVLNIGGLTNASTYADGADYDGHDHKDDVQGNAAEDAIHDIIVYIFDYSYKCEAVIVSHESPVDTVLVIAGTKHFLAVVNSDAVFTGTQALPKVASAVVYSDLRKSLSDKVSTLPASAFLMVGEKLHVPVTDQKPYSNPNRITIGVERACAKITMQFTKSLLATSHTITIQRVTMYQGANRIYLFDRPSAPDIDYILSKSVFTSSIDNLGVIDNLPNYIAMRDTFYTYAADCGQDSTNAVHFEIESTVNSPFNIKTAKFYLYGKTGGDTIYDVKRNYWYDIKVNMVDPGMDSVYVTITAARWDVADTQEEIKGEGYEIIEMASPFRLVKNLTDAQMTIAPTSAAIVEHPKGASWFDLKVSNGASWSLIFKSLAENADAVMSIDGGATWHTSLGGTWSGTDSIRIFVYRPYDENAEPTKGPTLALSFGGTYSGGTSIGGSQVGGVYEGGNHSNGKYVRDIVVQGRDLVPFPTNSYILRPRLTGTPINETRVFIPLNEVYSFWEDYLLPTGDSIQRINVAAQLSWKDSLSGVLLSNVSVINDDSRDAYLYAEAGTVQGNAVVDFIVNGTIYWSYHLWVTEYNPYEPAGQKLWTLTKTVFMDRNLGALSNIYDDLGDARGLYYQFGRKDPFPRGSGWTNDFRAYDGSGSALMMVTGFLSSVGVFPNPPLAIPTTIHNPLTFYANDPNWPLYTEDNYLWETPGGNKTAYDPCPTGWRVPKQENPGSSNSPWYGIGFQVSTNGRYDSTVGYYPYSGFIRSSFISRAPSEGYWWTAWKGVDDETGTGLHLLSTAPDPDMQPDIPKYYGASVRCVVDDAYLKKVEDGGLFGKYAQDLINNIQ